MWPLWCCPTPLFVHALNKIEFGIKYTGSKTLSTKPIDVSKLKFV